jgi:hypothetical protein
MKRFHQLLLIGTFLPLCWLAMQALHEAGHVAAGLATGQAVSAVVLHPLTISRTDFVDGSRPLVVVWAGPLVGVLAPLALWSIFMAAKVTWCFLVRFFAGTCLIANGAYIGVGSFGDVGDAGEMLRQSSPIWLLCLFGAAAFSLGLLLWNGLGPDFGLGSARGVVDRRAACVSCSLLVLVLILEFALRPR